MKRLDIPFEANNYNRPTYKLSANYLVADITDLEKDLNIVVPDVLSGLEMYIKS
jgi:hypothetical protein